jgi:hypothetical protein
MSQPAVWRRKTVATWLLRRSLGVTYRPLITYVGLLVHWLALSLACWLLEPSESPRLREFSFCTTNPRFNLPQYRSSAVCSAVRVPADCAAAQSDQYQAIIASSTVLCE